MEIFFILSNCFTSVAENLVKGNFYVHPNFSSFCICCMQALPGPHKWTLGLDVVKTSAEGSVAQCTTGVAGPVADLVTAGRKQQAYQRDTLCHTAKSWVTETLGFKNTDN